MSGDRAQNQGSSDDRYCLRHARPRWPRHVSDSSLADKVDAETWTKPSSASFGGPTSASRASDTREETPSSLYSGRTLGSYRLLERIGRGAQGEVWKGVRTDVLHDPVAIKVLRPSLASNPARRAQFVHEGERCGRLSGDFLLPVFETAEFDGCVFMVMPFVSGVTLRDVIHGRVARRSGEDSTIVHEMVSMNDLDYTIEALRILRSTALALARVHEMRIVHRDVKPANILLDNQRGGSVYLCDFGLGRDLDKATPTQMRDGSGTPLYMAPERLARQPADEIKSDIYSLGVTIYETLVLQRPFLIPRGLDNSGLSIYLATAKLVPPTMVDSRFPPDQEAVILKALARNPEDRYDSARELAVELDRFSAHWARAARQARPRRAESRRTRPDAPHDALANREPTAFREPQNSPQNRTVAPPRAGTGASHRAPELTSSVKPIRTSDPVSG